MNPRELAEKLNGLEYPVDRNIDKALCEQARADGLVIVFGSSDDLMEFRGAISNEFGCYDGGTAYLTTSGLLEDQCDADDCPYFAREKEQAVPLEAVWVENKLTLEDGEEGYAWTYRTEIPHETFDVIEDGEPFCRGIVFRLADVGAPTLKEMHLTQSGLDMQLEGGACQALAEAFGQQFKDVGAENYLEMTFHHKDVGHMTVTLQRTAGETPAGKASRFERQRDQLLDLLCQSLPYVEEAENDPGYKPGTVAELTAKIRAAVEAEGGAA